MKKVRVFMRASFGDRACLALGIIHNQPVLTTDRLWGGITLGIEVRVKEPIASIRHLVEIKYAQPETLVGTIHELSLHSFSPDVYYIKIFITYVKYKNLCILCCPNCLVR